MLWRAHTVWSFCAKSKCGRANYTVVCQMLSTLLVWQAMEEGEGLELPYTELMLLEKRITLVCTCMTKHVCGTQKSSTLALWNPTFTSKFTQDLLMPPYRSLFSEWQYLI